MIWYLQGDFRKLKYNLIKAIDFAKNFIVKGV